MLHGIVLLTLYDETLTEQWSRIALPPRIAPFVCFLYIPVEVFWTWSKNIGRAMLHRPLIGDTEDLIWLHILHWLRWHEKSRKLYSCMCPFCHVSC